MAKLISGERPSPMIESAFSERYSHFSIKKSHESVKNLEAYISDCVDESGSSVATHEQNTDIEEYLDGSDL